jgi:hypothetical protein
MKYIKTLTAIAATTWLVAGCAGTSPEQQQAYEQAMSEAEAAHKKALSVEYAWRDTAKLMKSAKEAAEKGEIDKATKLATKARKESELAYNQYLQEKTAGADGIR